jgi:hypothetical protein
MGGSVMVAMPYSNAKTALGWYWAPKDGKDMPGTLFHYIGASGDPGDPPEVRQGAKFDKEWEKKAKEKNGTIGELMKQYWSDRETIVNWDEAAKGCSEKGNLNWDRLVEAAWPHKSS